MLVAFSVTPLGVGQDVAEYVADAVRVVRESGLPNRTDAMFTTVEGDCLLAGQRRLNRFPLGYPGGCGGDGQPAHLFISCSLCALGNGLDVGLDELPLA
jgi:Thiamine-binding protein